MQITKERVNGVRQINVPYYVHICKGSGEFPLLVSWTAKM